MVVCVCVCFCSEVCLSVCLRKTASDNYLCTIGVTTLHMEECNESVCMCTVCLCVCVSVLRQGHILGVAVSVDGLS